MAANMISAIDSEVAFEALVKRRGFANLWPRFEEFGWTSAASFAYVLGVNYSNVAEEMFIDKIVCVMLRMNRGAYDARVAQDGKDPKERLLLSRLFGEAQRMLHVSLKALEGPGETPQHINDADRTQRRKAYATQIQNAGLYFEDEMCHAHCIEDDAFLMLQRGHLSYLHPKHCPTVVSEAESLVRQAGSSRVFEFNLLLWRKLLSRTPFPKQSIRVVHREQQAGRL